LNLSLPKSPLSKNHQLTYWASTWLLFLFPFVLYVIYVIRYSLNIPIWDDFDLILHFINNFVLAASLKERLLLLFLQHNEHRMVFERIIFVLQYYLFGEVTFESLNYFGNLGWLLSVAFLAYVWKDKNHPSALDLLPYAYLLLAFIYTESMFWASSSLSFYWSAFFALLFIYFLVRDSCFLICALLGLALFTSGGGLGLIPLALGYLLIKRHYKHLIIFTLYSLVIVSVYFYHYAWPQPGEDLFRLTDFLLYLKYGFTFLGASWELLTGVQGSGLVCGVIGCLFLAVLWFKSPSDDFTWLLLGFVVLVAAEAALLRSRLGIGQALSTRYAQYSMLFWCSLIFISTRTFLNHPRFWFASVTLLAIFLFFRYAFIAQELGVFEKLATTKSSSICAFQQGYSYGLLYPDEARARKILFVSRRLGVYDYKALECAPFERELNYHDDSKLSILNLAPGHTGKFTARHLQGHQTQSINLLPGGLVTFASWRYFYLDKEMDLIPCVSKT
jgi:hypothetical protein